jgi:hypothetical protein
MIYEYGAFGGIKIIRRKRSTRKKAASLPLTLPQIPHKFNWDRSQAAAVAMQQPTAKFNLKYVQISLPGI